jgi:hypothetical protein
MEEIIDLIATDSSPSEISNKIKEVLFTKASERVDTSRPFVASSLFGESESDDESSTEDAE